MEVKHTFHKVGNPALILQIIRNTAKMCIAKYINNFFVARQTKSNAFRYKMKKLISSQLQVISIRHTLTWAITVAVQYTKIIHCPNICTIWVGNKIWLYRFATAPHRLPELTVEAMIRTGGDKVYKAGDLYLRYFRFFKALILSVFTVN